jgi:hypothetical protein
MTTVMARTAREKSQWEMCPVAPLRLRKYVPAMNANPYVVAKRSSQRIISFRCKGNATDMPESKKEKARKLNPIGKPSK